MYSIRLNILQIIHPQPFPDLNKHIQIHIHIRDYLYFIVISALLCLYF